MFINQSLLVVGGSICHRPHDGWERQFNKFNNLKGVVCATCAVRDYMLHEIYGNLDADVELFLGASQFDRLDFIVFFVSSFQPSTSTLAQKPKLKMVQV